MFKKNKKKINLILAEEFTKYLLLREHRENAAIFLDFLANTEIESCVRIYKCAKEVSNNLANTTQFVYNVF